MELMTSKSDTRKKIFSTYSNDKVSVLYFNKFINAYKLMSLKNLWGWECIMQVDHPSALIAALDLLEPTFMAMGLAHRFLAPIVSHHPRPFWVFHPTTIKNNLKNSQKYKRKKKHFCPITKTQNSYSLTKLQTI